MEKDEKYNLNKLHTKNMNKYASSRISNKMNKITDLVSSQIKNARSHPLSTSVREPQMVSFRPNCPQ